MYFDSVCGRLLGSLPASESQGLRFLHLEFLFMMLECLGLEASPEPCQWIDLEPVFSQKIVVSLWISLYIRTIGE